MLRACGFALFPEVASRYKAGVANFEISDLGVAASTILAQNWESLRDLGLLAAQNYPNHVKVCAHRKTLSVPPMYVVSLTHPRCFFYLYRLADSRGFDSIVRVLERVWERAVSGLSEADLDLNFEKTFENIRASEKPDFSYRPFQYFPGQNIYPGPVTITQLGVDGNYGSQQGLRQGLSRAVLGLFSAKLAAVLYYLYFVQAVHNQFYLDLSHSSFRNMFRGMLDLSI